MGRDPISVHIAAQRSLGAVVHQGEVVPLVVERVRPTPDLECYIIVVIDRALKLFFVGIDPQHVAPGVFQDHDPALVGGDSDPGSDGQHLHAKERVDVLARTHATS